MKISIECDNCDREFEPEEETILTHETDYAKTPIYLEVCPRCKAKYQYWGDNSHICSISEEEIRVIEEREKKNTR